MLIMVALTILLTTLAFNPPPPHIAVPINYTKIPTAGSYEISGTALSPQPPYPLVPGQYPQPPIAGMTEFQGILDEACVDLTVYIFLGFSPDGTLLGSAIVSSDGTFSVTLNRPLAEGEAITVYAECRDSIFIWDSLYVAPPIIPEPTTLVLVGSGLGLLALRRLWR